MGVPQRRYRGGVLGLPDHVTACLFDLDGVLTPTAIAHKAAWEEAFNAYLRQRAERTGEPYVPFDPGPDYHQYVDGKARADGVRSFLASRQITIPEGTPDDPPTADTVHGLGNRKNEQLLAVLRERGVAPYPDAAAYLQAAVAAGLRRAVVSASANCAEVLAAAGLTDQLEVRVDGVVARQEGLPGKPAPDTFLAAAARLGVAPEHAAVFEDALAGVAAGRAGGFGFVVGVDRPEPPADPGPNGPVSESRADELRAHGADIVVRDLAELLNGHAPASTALGSGAADGSGP